MTRESDWHPTHSVEFIEDGVWWDEVPRGSILQYQMWGELEWWPDSL